MVYIWYAKYFCGRDMAGIAFHWSSRRCGWDTLRNSKRTGQPPLPQSHPGCWVKMKACSHLFVVELSYVNMDEYGITIPNNPFLSRLDPTKMAKPSQRHCQWSACSGMITHIFVAVVGTLRQFCPVSAYHWHPIILHQLTSGYLWYLPKSFALASDVYLFWSLGQL